MANYMEKLNEATTYVEKFLCYTVLLYAENDADLGGDLSILQKLETMQRKVYVLSNDPSTRCFDGIDVKILKMIKSQWSTHVDIHGASQDTHNVFINMLVAQAFPQQREVIQ